MPENPVALVQELLATVGRNDVEAAVAMSHPELEFVDVLAPMEQTVRDVRGPDGFREWFAGLHVEGVKRVTAEPFDLQELPDGRVVGTVRVAQESSDESFTITVYGLWELEDGLFRRIHSFFDRKLALAAAGLEERSGLSRRWVEGVLSAKALDRHAVVLRSADHDGTQLSVGDEDLWNSLRVGEFGIAELDHGELIGWRPHALPGADRGPAA